MAASISIEKKPKLDGFGSDEEVEEDELEVDADVAPVEKKEGDEEEIDEETIKKLLEMMNGK